jgi:sugar diacid utilization regulator
MLNIQYRNLEDSINLQQQLVGMVLEGKGLKNIVQTMCMLIGASAMVLNERNKVVTHYGNTAELQAFAFSSHGLGLSLGKDDSGTRLVMLPVSAGGRQLGVLIVGEAQRQFTDMDMVAIRQTATVIALEMLKGIEVELQYRTNFFDQLLAGKHDNPQSLQEQGEKIGFNLANEHQLVLIEAEDNAENTRKIGKRASVELTLEDFLQAVTKAAEECAPGSAVFTKDGSIILLVKVIKSRKGYSPDVSKVVNYVLDNLKRIAPGRQFWITVGRLSRNLGDYPKSFDEARAALKMMKKLKLPDEVLFYDRLGVFSIMFDIDPQKLNDFINQVLGNLIEYDKKKNGDLVETLRFYIKNHYNLQQAAKAGFLSPSTLKYRLKKIQEVGNLDLNNADDRLLVELALKIIWRV